jgi:hypothetical protein
LISFQFREGLLHTSRPLSAAPHVVSGHFDNIFSGRNRQAVFLHFGRLHTYRRECYFFGYERYAVFPRPILLPRPAMKGLLSLLDLPIRLILALIGFVVGGWIGWLGILLVVLRACGVIHWSWWLAALPLEYGVIYCLYMTIDGALYRAGVKKVGRCAEFTQAFKQD